MKEIEWLFGDSILLGINLLVFIFLDIRLRRLELKTNKARKEK